ncbi:MAG: FkbM family methyltransferase [Acidimicrobiales bacterium]
MVLLKRFTARSLPQHDLEIFAKKVRVALTPRGRMLTTKLSSGAVVYGANRAGFGARKVFIYGDAVEPEFEHLERFLSATGVFVEIGANTGKYTIKAAKHYGDSGVVLAVEPFLEMLSTLSRSVDANGFTNVRLRNFCVADRMSIGTLWMNRGEPHKFSLVRSDETASGISTLTVSLDELFRWEGLDRLDYLKIDAEGAEEQVLWGGHETIERHRPIIQVDVTLSDVSVDLPEYSGFRAPGSAAKFYMPNEHETIDVPRQLGWRALV